VIGSSPREVGAQMSVWANHVSGTIGGGSMEYSAIEYARSELSAQSEEQEHQCQNSALLASVLLNPKNDQCCGGKVELMYEYQAARQSSGFVKLVESLQAMQQGYYELTLANYQIARQPIKLVVTQDQVHAFSGGERYIGYSSKPKSGQFDLNLAATANSSVLLAQESLYKNNRIPFLHRTTDEDIWVGQYRGPIEFNISIYGAGHVAKELVHILSNHNCQIRWIDSRDGVFPDIEYSNVDVIHDPAPSQTVSDAPRSSFFLVMTHSHKLDFDLCDHILAREDIHYLGLIGSSGKARRFRNQFKQRGLSPQELGPLICPIGIEGIKSKTASAIAISIAAQLVVLHESDAKSLNDSRVSDDERLATEPKISYGWETKQRVDDVDERKHDRAKT
jgi:xanthine dehydrogenase accessory factor